MNPAQRTDWKALEMPERRARLSVERVFTRDEFARLCFGVVPRSMEDKWFVFFESPWLHVHRSWTGVCVYQIRIAQAASGVEIAEVIVNRESEQSGEPDEKADAQRLLFLLDSILQRNARYANVRAIADFSGLSP